MAYPQNLLNKYIRYRIDPGGSISPELENRIVNGVLPGQTLAATVTVQDHTGVFAGSGLAGHPAWWFTFLKYVAGAVTTAPLTIPVLTGPMSGCYLCRYKEGGQNYLAHIGTFDLPNTALSIKAKTSWKSFVALPTVSDVMGGDPSECFTDSELTVAVPLQSLNTAIWGYFTPDGRAYSLLLIPVRNAPQLLKVVGVKSMELKPWASIATLETFQ